MAYPRNRQRQRYKAGSRSVKEDRQGYALFICAGIIVLGLLGYFMYIAEGRSAIDSGTFCKKKQDDVTVVLIDHTDQFNAVQMAELKRELWNVAQNHVQPHSALKLIAVTTNPNELLKEDKVFCNPGDDSTVSSIDGNKGKAKELYERKYKARIETMLQDMMDTKSKSSSPIMEALQAVSVTTFKGENAPVHKHLIFVSDLLQHTNEFTIYHGVPDFSDFEQTPYWKKIKTDFSDVDVEMLFVRRDGEDGLQNSKLIEFWRDYFGEQGVTALKSKPIDG